MKSKYLEIILTLALIAVVVSGFATTWSQSSTLVHPGYLGMSADGRIILVAASDSRAFVSTNSGQTWNIATNGPPPALVGVAVSADGTKILLASVTNVGPSFTVTLSISTNYGNTWNISIITNNAGGRVACSADGTKLIAGLGKMCFSTNGGTTWQTSSQATTNWASAASSADGQLMVAAVNGGTIYLSTNFGASWAPTSLPSISWNSVCVSSDGSVMGAIATGSGAYLSISRDRGAHWTTNTVNDTVNGYGSAIACSANGANWMIAGSQILLSSDGGVTWSTLNLPVSDASLWYSGAISADGCEFMVVGSPGIWAGRNTPAPQLNIQPADQALNLSWLIPSTNFVLQQNPDLTTTNWTAVSNSPVLNFTNLQQQVSVPSSPSNTFFRLIAQ